MIVLVRQVGVVVRNASGLVSLGIPQQVPGHTVRLEEEILSEDGRLATAFLLELPPFACLRLGIGCRRLLVGVVNLNTDRERIANLQVRYGVKVYLVVHLDGRPPVVLVHEEVLQLWIKILLFNFWLFTRL